MSTIVRAKHVFWGPSVSQTFVFEWDQIHYNSFVVITASEGRERLDDFNLDDPHLYAVSPARFVGLDSFTVHNISPYEGGVQFSVTIEGAVQDKLLLWTDIIIIEPDGPFVESGDDRFSTIEWGDSSIVRRLDG